MPEAKRYSRMQVMRQQIKPNFRATAYSICNCFVNQQRIWMETMRMDASTLLVYMIVALAGIQKLVRLGEIPELLSGFEPLPQELVGAISRRAVASASGMPRETVRRIIAELLESGRLIKSGRNAVRVARDNARSEGFIHVPSLLLTEILKMINELQRLGIVVDSAAADAIHGDMVGTL